MTKLCESIVMPEGHLDQFRFYKQKNYDNYVSMWLKKQSTENYKQMKNKNEKYYTVETKFWRKRIGNKLDFLQSGGDICDAYQRSVKEFRNDSPIIAREQAFSHFQSIVEVLYEAINKPFVSDEQARLDLQEYLNSGNDFELFGNKTPEHRHKISDDVFNGICVFMIVEDLTIKKSKKIQIHSINYLEYLERPDEEIQNSLKGLIQEVEVYEQFDYPYAKYHELIALHPIGGKVESILKTPFNWKTYVKKYDGMLLM